MVFYISIFISTEQVEKFMLTDVDLMSKLISIVKWKNSVMVKEAVLAAIYYLISSSSQKIENQLRLTQESTLCPLLTLLRANYLPVQNLTSNILFTCLQNEKNRKELIDGGVDSIVTLLSMDNVPSIGKRSLLEVSMIILGVSSVHVSWNQSDSPKEDKESKYNVSSKEMESAISNFASNKKIPSVFANLFGHYINIVTDDKERSKIYEQVILHLCSIVVKFASNSIYLSQSL